ncbi:hypothetical protein DFH08DRAFT_1086233 [Mycena albidolilacea]|uniref:Uncharacterized protein n=1 Tax=Mycena albidolilacea TaxID=1033008 RepID=A0AAD6ZFY6_9AGAR|nr:hypothetical protein DFH08DRAFT_1086233 [Mycena albidolilacea]
MISTTNKLSTAIIVPHHLSSFVTLDQANSIHIELDHAPPGISSRRPIFWTTVTSIMMTHPIIGPVDLYFMLAGCPCFRKGDESVFSRRATVDKPTAVNLGSSILPHILLLMREPSAIPSPTESRQAGSTTFRPGFRWTPADGRREVLRRRWTTESLLRAIRGSDAQHSRSVPFGRSALLASGAPRLKDPAPRIVRQAPGTNEVLIQVCMYQARKPSMRCTLYPEDVKDYSDDARFKTEADSTLTSSGTERGPDGYGRCPRPTEALHHDFHLDSDQASDDFAPPRFRPRSDQASDERMEGWTTGSTDDSEPSDEFRSDGTTPPIPIPPRRGLLHDSALSDHHDAAAAAYLPSFLPSFPSPYFRLASRRAYRHRAVPTAGNLESGAGNKPEQKTAPTMRCDAMRCAAAAFSFSFSIAEPYPTAVRISARRCLTVLPSSYRRPAIPFRRLSMYDAALTQSTCVLYMLQVARRRKSAST